jgi:hypothetical protein
MGPGEFFVLAVPASIAVAKVVVVAIAVAWFVKGSFQPANVKLQNYGWTDRRE